METDNLRKISSRKWLLTINNPIEKGYTHEHIKEILSTLKLSYWCMSDETGHEGTFHTHIFLAYTNGIKASTIHNKFNGAHRDIARGTCQQNRDYVFKEGKWLDGEKGTTNHRDSHEEWGEMPVERQGARNDLTDLYDMIKEGLSTYEILEQSPQYIMQLEKIDKIRQTVVEEKYKNTWRTLEVTYIWGVTGSGKSRYIKEKYGYSNVYSVTDYLHPFDGYKGQDVIVFDEFRSSLRIDDMLKYLDGYPLELPCRYNNKCACFTKVYFATNIDLRAQYPNVQNDEKMTYNAFLRRIHNVMVFDGTNITTMDTATYLKDFFPCFKSPFDKEEETV